MQFQIKNGTKKNEENHDAFSTSFKNIFKIELSYMKTQQRFPFSR